MVTNLSRFILPYNLRRPDLPLPSALPLNQPVDYQPEEEPPSPPDLTSQNLSPIPQPPSETYEPPPSDYAEQRPADADLYGYINSIRAKEQMPSTMPVERDLMQRAEVPHVKTQRPSVDTAYERGRRLAEQQGRGLFNVPVDAGYERGRKLAEQQGRGLFAAPTDTGPVLGRPDTSRVIRPPTPQAPIPRGGGMYASPVAPPTASTFPGAPATGSALLELGSRAVPPGAPLTPERLKERNILQAKNPDDLFYRIGGTTDELQKYIAKYGEHPFGILQNAPKDARPYMLAGMRAKVESRLNLMREGERAAAGEVTITPLEQQMMAGGGDIPAVSPYETPANQNISAADIETPRAIGAAGYAYTKAATGGNVELPGYVPTQSQKRGDIFSPENVGSVAGMVTNLLMLKSVTPAALAEMGPVISNATLFGMQEALNNPDPSGAMSFHENAAARAVNFLKGAGKGALIGKLMGATPSIPREQLSMVAPGALATVGKGIAEGRTPEQIGADVSSEALPMVIFPAAGGLLRGIGGRQRPTGEAAPTTAEPVAPAETVQPKAYAELPPPTIPGSDPNSVPATIARQARLYEEMKDLAPNERQNLMAEINLRVGTHQELPSDAPMLESARRVDADISRYRSEGLLTAQPLPSTEQYMAELKSVYAPEPEFRPSGEAMKATPEAATADFGLPPPTPKVEPVAAPVAPEAPPQPEPIETPYTTELKPPNVPKAVPVEAELLPPSKAPSKPLYEMSDEELDAEYQRAKQEDKGVEVEVFGEEGARRYGILQKVANSTMRPFNETMAASREIEDMENSLSEAQRNKLYGIGEDVRSPEEVRAFMSGSYDYSSPESMADSIKYDISKLAGTQESDPANMNEKEQVAYRNLNQARQNAEEQGWDFDNIFKQGVLHAANRFVEHAGMTPDSALEMVERFIKPKGERAPAEQPPVARPELPPYVAEPQLEAVTEPAPNLDDLWKNYADAVDENKRIRLELRKASSKPAAEQQAYTEGIQRQIDASDVKKAEAAKAYFDAEKAQGGEAPQSEPTAPTEELPPPDAPTEVKTTADKLRSIADRLEAEADEYLKGGPQMGALGAPGEILARSKKVAALLLRGGAKISDIMANLRAQFGHKFDEEDFDEIERQGVEMADRLRTEQPEPMPSPRELPPPSQAAPQLAVAGAGPVIAQASGETATRTLAESARPSMLPELEKIVPAEDYQRLTHADSYKAARDIIDNEPERALIMAKGNIVGPIENAVGITLVADAQQRGDWAGAKEIMDAMNARGTLGGQATEILKTINHISPEGAPLYASSVVDTEAAKVSPELRGAISSASDKIKALVDAGNLTADALRKAAREGGLVMSKAKAQDLTLKINAIINDPAFEGEFNAADVKDLLNRKYKVPSVNEKDLAEIYKMAIDAQNITNPKDRQIATALMMKKIGQLAWPNPSKLQKVNEFIAVGKLLGSGVMGRFFVRHVGFGVLEAGTKFPAAGFDKVLSAALGTNREIYTPQLKTMAKDFAAKTAESVVNVVRHGLAPGEETATAAIKPRAMNSRIGRAMWTAHDIFIGSPPQGIQAAFENEAARDIRRGEGMPADEPLSKQQADTAKHRGQIPALQDTNALSKALAMIQNIPIIGRAIQLYSRTPASGFLRKLEYTPLGFVRGAYELGARPFIKGTEGLSYSQNVRKYEASMALARGTIGAVGIISLGAAATAAGLIVEQPDDSRAAQLAASQGIPKRGWNLSGTYRLFTGDDPAWRKGDKIYNYSWIEPVSGIFDIGHNIAKAAQSGDSAAMQASSVLFNSTESFLSEDRLLSSLKQKLTVPPEEEGGYLAVIGGAIQDVPPLFLPAFITELRPLFDPLRRDTYMSNKTLGGFVIGAFKKAIDQIPGLSTENVPVIGPHGEEKLRTRDLTEYNPTPEGQYALGIYSKAGKTVNLGGHGYAPYLTPAAPKSITLNQPDGTTKEIETTPEQRNEFNQYTGNAVGRLHTIASGSEYFKSLPAREQAKILSRYVTNIQMRANVAVLGQRYRNQDEIMKDTVPHDPVIFDHNSKVDLAHSQAERFARQDPDYRALSPDNQAKVDEQIKSNYKNYKIQENPEASKEDLYNDAKDAGKELDEYKRQVEPDAKIPQWQFDVKAAIKDYRQLQNPELETYTPQQTQENQNYYSQPSLPGYAARPGVR